MYKVGVNETSCRR